MRTAILFAVVLLASCKKEQAVSVQYRVLCNKCAVEYATPTGTSHQLVRGEWNKEQVFEEGDELSMSACRVQYDTAITNDGQDTTLSEVPYFGITMWAFEKGARLATESAGNPGDAECTSFTARVPEE
mgnify:FL=1